MEEGAEKLQTSQFKLPEQAWKAKPLAARSKTTAKGWYSDKVCDKVSGETKCVTKWRTERGGFPGFSVGCWHRGCC